MEAKNDKFVLVHNFSLTAELREKKEVSKVKILNFQRPKMFAVITLKLKQRSLSIEKPFQNLQMEWETV